MRPEDLAQTLTSLIPTRQCLFVWGSPGIGKSDIIRQAAKSLDYDLIDIRATLLDACDIRGLPRVTGDNVEWCPPAFLPKDGNGVLFLDELPQAVPLVQASLLQLTLDRAIGEYRLPDGWTVVAAGNEASDRAGTHRLISPLLNRFIHISAEVSTEDWNNWAVVNNVSPEVRAFIRFRPTLLFNFEPSANPKAFPTPRSWAMVSKVLGVTPKHLVQRVVSGAVGEGPAAEFYSFLELYKNLPDLDQVLANPLSAQVPTNPGVLYALVSALIENVKVDKKKVSNFVKYATRLPDEFSMLALRDATVMDPSIIQNADVKGWVIQANKKGMFAGSV